jgi:D-threo-aldose 1-dehydrogenase
MRTNMLGRTGIAASHLGFGCSQLTTLKDRQDAIQILDHAFALGITHFDVARIYGSGRSERILGEFLRGKRHQVTVATKFGIQPPSGLAGNRRVINLVKKVLGPFPSLLHRASQSSSKMTQTGMFTPQSAVQSLEVSLRELGTDFVDIFFLHEGTLDDAAREPLVEVLEQQVKRGTIRCLGVASRFQTLREDARRLPSTYQVLQFEDNVLARNLSTLVHREGCGLISHTIFQPFSILRGAIVAQPALTQKYAVRTNLNLADSSVLGSLLMQYALCSNPDGVVLFSSTRIQRLASNVRDAESCPYSDQQLSEFVKFAEEICCATATE